MSSHRRRAFAIAELLGLILLPWTDAKSLAWEEAACAGDRCTRELHREGRLLGRAIHRAEQGEPRELLRLMWYQTSPAGAPQLRQVWSYETDDPESPLPDIEIFDPTRGAEHVVYRASRAAHLADGGLYYERFEFFEGAPTRPTRTIRLAENLEGRLVRSRERHHPHDSRLYRDVVFDQRGELRRWHLVFDAGSSRIREAGRYDDTGALVAVTHFDTEGRLASQLDPAGAPLAPSPALVPARNGNPFYGLRLLQLGLRLREYVAAEPEDELFLLGDSITSGWDDNDFHRAVLRDTFGRWDAFVGGIQGERVEHVSWRIDNGGLDGVAPRLLVLTIGLNNLLVQQPPDLVAEGIVGLLVKLRARLPETKILLMMPFPAGIIVGSKARTGATRIRELLWHLADGETWFVEDISSGLVEADGTLKSDLFVDNVHLNARGYRVWGEGIAAPLDVLMRP